MLGAFFRDPANLIAVHRGWCCDSCAAASPQGLGHYVTAGIRADISILNELASSAKLKPSRQTTVGEHLRDETITHRHVALVKGQFLRFRELIALNHPMPWIIPATVIPDRVIEEVSKNLERITSAEQLVNELGKAGLVQRHSLLTRAHVDVLYDVIERIISGPTTWQPILPRPDP
jgi:hypothetical protein